MIDSYSATNPSVNSEHEQTFTSAAFISKEMNSTEESQLASKRVFSYNFDNHDSRIKYFQLILERDLDDLPQFPLPEGFSYIFYQDGDKDSWINIEKSAKEFATYEDGLKAWDRFFSSNEDILPNRMLFIQSPEGEKIATATALFDVTGRDQSGSAWLHWVSVRRDFQGKHLSKPLITKCLSLMVELGYKHVKIPTQTTTWLACKIYLDLGFRPIPKNKISSKDGWRIIKALTNHESLAEFDPASFDEIIGQT